MIKTLRVLFLLFILSSCSKRERSFQEYQRAVGSMEKAYVSSNISVAVQGLKTYTQTIASLSKNSTGNIDYGGTLGLANARMFVVCEVIRDMESAESAYHASTNLLYRSAIRNGRPAALLSREDLRELVLKADSTLNVGWKTNSNQ
jgi:hypothetical protein